MKELSNLIQKYKSQIKQYDIVINGIEDQISLCQEGDTAIDVLFQDKRILRIERNKTTQFLEELRDLNDSISE